MTTDSAIDPARPSCAKTSTLAKSTLANAASRRPGLCVSCRYSYLRDGWNASVHLVYSTRAENKETNYKSGVELLLNVTALKDVGGLPDSPLGLSRLHLLLQGQFSFGVRCKEKEVVDTQFDPSMNQIPFFEAAHFSVKINTCCQAALLSGIVVMFRML
jgi:Putative MetA-pathway of phenol degradation